MEPLLNRGLLFSPSPHNDRFPSQLTLSISRVIRSGNGLGNCSGSLMAIWSLKLAQSLAHIQTIWGLEARLRCIQARFLTSWGST